MTVTHPPGALDFSTLDAWPRDVACDLFSFGMFIICRSIPQPACSLFIVYNTGSRGRGYVRDTPYVVASRHPINSRHENMARLRLRDCQRPFAWPPEPHHLPESGNGWWYARSYEATSARRQCAPPPLPEASRVSPTSRRPIHIMRSTVAPYRTRKRRVMILVARVTRAYIAYV